MIRVMFVRLLMLVLLYGHVMMASAIQRQDQAPNFVLPLLGKPGQVLRLAQYKGKVVYLDFWAADCLACRQSFPVFNRLYHRYVSQGFEIVAINLDHKVTDGTAFLKQVPVDYPVIWDYDGTVARKYDVKVLPSGFLLDSEGKVRLIHLGMSPQHEDFLAAVIEKLLAEQIQ